MDGYGKKRRQRKTRSNFKKSVFDVCLSVSQSILQHLQTEEMIYKKGPDAQQRKKKDQAYIATCFFFLRHHCINEPRRRERIAYGRTTLVI